MMFFYLLIGFLVIFQVFYSGFYFLKAKALSKQTFTGNFEVGEKGKPEFTIVVEGDSVGAGVGAKDFSETLVGRLANFYSKNYFVKIANNSKSGAKISNLKVSETPNNNPNLLLLVIGSNDLFRFTKLDEFEKSTTEVLEKFAPSAKKIVLIGPGRVYDATAIPILFRPIYKLKADSYSKILAKTAAKYPNVIYVNPTNTTKKPSDYGHTLASDNFHPNGNGYSFWFDLVKEALN